MNALELRGLTKHYKDFTLGPLDLPCPAAPSADLIVKRSGQKHHISG